MKRIFVGLILIIIIAGCNKSSLTELQSKQFYSLINDYIIDSLYNADIISREVMMFENENYDQDSPPPPPGVYCSYSDFTFKELLDSNIIDSMDVTLFKKQMLQKGQFYLDENKINIKTFSRDSLNNILLDNKDIRLDFWNYFKENYHSNSFIIISYPLFSEDFNTILLSINFWCGELCAEGSIFVFKKVNGKWSKIYWDRSFVS